MFVISLVERASLVARLSGFHLKLWDFSRHRHEFVAPE